MEFNNYNGPKYEMVKEYIKHLLKDGIVAYGEKLPSEHEFTEKFKISRHTVRQAISDLTGEGLVHREQGKGTFSNYKNGNKNKQIIAVVTTYLSAFVFPGIISGIEQVLSDEGYMMLLSNTNNKKEREAQFLNSVLEHNVVGIIVEPSKSAHGNVNLPLFLDVQKKGIKTLFINAFYDDFESSYVIMDDEKGGYIATEYLLQLGHKKIAGIFKTDDMQGLQRKKGYLQAVRDYGGIIDPRFVGEYDVSNMYFFPYMYSQSLLRDADFPTAFFCYNDQVALMVMQAINEKGLKVPDDISVVGYDDSIASSMLSDIKLTTILHPKKKLGIQAAKFMLDMLDGRIERPQMVYSPELLVRSSCRKG
jgi:GntR family transcriptional regulator of arabinose operon